MPKPKVISLFKTDDFQNRFLNIPTIGTSKDLFVECKSYELVIPVNGKIERELNIFEEAVIRMISLKKSSVSELAKTLCLEKDFVYFVLLRLKENGLLYDNQTISDEGKKVLDRQMSAKSEVEFIQGKLFVIIKTGQILPYIHIGEFHSEIVDEFNKSSMTVFFGSTGNPKKSWGSRIRNTDIEREREMKSILETNIIKKHIKTYNKIAGYRNLTLIDLAEGFSIESSASDNIYFHLKAVVQEGNVDEVMFSDGFVSNIDGISDYISTENPALLSDIKSHAVEMTVLGTVEERKIKMELKYPEIYGLLKNIDSHNIYLTESADDLDTIKRVNEAKKQILLDCYYLVEWVFYYHTIKNPLSSQISDLLKKQKVSKNAETLMQFATSIGIKDANDYEVMFSHIDSNKIHGVYYYKSPQIYVCLPLAIAEAKENSASCFHSLIKKDRNILHFIDKLNEKTGGLRHDANEEMIDMDIEEILRHTKRIIYTLLPELDYEKDISKSDEPNDLSRQRLLAQVSLERQLGSICYAAMSPGLKNDWLKISPDKSGKQLPDFREYIEILYRILQTEITAANSEITGKSLLTQNDALKRLSNRHIGPIPKSFSNIKKINYNMSTKGGKSTLGAEALVYIANVSNETAESLEEAEFTNVVDKVVSLRGHAEMTVLNETEQSLNELRSKVIKLTKLIGGYYA